MSVYFKQGKGWRYDITVKGQRATEAWFKTKQEAITAREKRREELKNPPQTQKEPIDTGFLDLINARLDNMKEYNTEKHYRDNCYMAKRWVKEWNNTPCRDITKAMVRSFILRRAKVSHFTANKEIRCLKATFNYGIENGLISENPVTGIKFLPVEKKVKRPPKRQDLDKVIAVADQDDQDYLYAIRDTMARVSEINRLTWEDVNLGEQTLALYTRKKKDGSLTAREIPLTKRLHSILSRRFEQRDPEIPWVFWHRYWSRKEGQMKVGPYQDRKVLMRKLCKKAGVDYFRYHSIRHFGASVLDSQKIATVTIQKLLGHENRETTEIYLHSIENSDTEAIRALELAK